MSSLAYICDYDSESEQSDCEAINHSRPKLPTPDLSKVPVILSETHVDDPELHGGRTRSFPHVRGNWPTFVYVEYTEKEALLNLIGKLEEKLSAQNQSWQRCDNIHISLSKTVVLNYHMITAFTSSLKKVIENTDSFELGFSGVKVYCNEEKSRTFIALEAEHLSQKYLLDLTRKVDQSLVEFKLPTFYDDASFHMSIFWINGNYKLEAGKILEQLNNIVYCEIRKSLKTVLIDKVYCKSGNKYFQYYLL